MTIRRQFKAILHVRMFEKEVFAPIRMKSRGDTANEPMEVERSRRGDEQKNNDDDDFAIHSREMKRERVFLLSIGSSR